eukprot:766356-Hanusia_phi.AAC.5
MIRGREVDTGNMDEVEGLEVNERETMARAQSLNQKKPEEMRRVLDEHLEKWMKGAGCNKAEGSISG